jgi:hypothetical protein
MTNKMISMLKTTTSICILMVLCSSCGKSDVDKCVDAQMEAFKECKSEGKEWCKEKTEMDRKAQMHLVCLQISTGNK